MSAFNNANTAYVVKYICACIYLYMCMCNVHIYYTCIFMATPIAYGSSQARD